MRYAPSILVLYLGTQEKAFRLQENIPQVLKMLFAKPLENNLEANQRYAMYAQNLIQCWNSMDQNSKHLAVANLNKKYAINCNIIDHEVAILVLKKKLDGDFKNFINS